MHDAAAIAPRDVMAFLKDVDRLKKVTLVCFSHDVFDAYRHALERSGDA
jgi:hypothetical protein